MAERLEKTIGRRDLLRVTVIGAAAVAAANAIAAEATATKSENRNEKRKARYQANSAEIQRFYAVNRYPAQ